MAVSSTVVDYSGVGTGTVAVFATGIYANEASQIVVTINGVQKMLGDDYTLANLGSNAGVNVTMFAGKGLPVYIERVTPITQEVDTQNNETILEDVLDAEFDKLTMIAQELARGVARALLFPKGESGQVLPAAAVRANRAITFDAAGNILLAPGSLAQLGADLTDIIARLMALELGSTTTPFNAAAVATDWSSMQNLARAVRLRAFTNTPIKFAGIGSSNMKNAGGGLAGPGNSPVEVAMRAAKAMLDPFNFCQWDFRNFGVNGSSYSGYAAAGLDDNPDPRSPRVKLLEYKPDVTIVCYGTNDAAPESWNSGQTRNYMPIGIGAIADDCKTIDSDVIFMTVPSAHVAKSIPVRINQTIPMGYPFTSWNYGQGGFIDFKVNFTAGSNRITSLIGAVFTNATIGFGMAVGKVIAITDPNLAPVTNGGQYRISAIDPAGNWIEVDKQMVFAADGFTLVPGPNAAFVTAANVSVAIKRIAIDWDTEQVPNQSNGSKTVYPLGAAAGGVQVLTRYFDFNQVQRELVATLDLPAAHVDIEAVYNVKLISFSEDRYYAPLERVHWNNVLVKEIMEPTFMAFFRALGPVPKTISNTGAPRYLRGLLVRPEAGTSDPLSQLDPNGTRRAIDLTPATGQNIVIREPGTRRIVMEIDASGQAGNIIRRLIDSAGGQRFYRRYTFAGYNIGAGGAAPADVRLVMPGRGLLTGLVRGYHNGIADTTYELKAQYDPGAGTPWDLRTSMRNSTRGPFALTETLTFSTSGATLIISPNAAGEEINYDLEFLAFTPTALATPDA